MAEVVRMPKMSDTMTEGVLVKWHKKVGDVVKPGDVVAEVETDKATMDFESFQEGTLLYVGVKEGETIPVDTIIAVLGKNGEDFQSLLNEKPAAKDDVSSVLKSNAEMPTPIPVQSISSTDEHAERIKASPLARKIAREQGIDLHSIQGSASNGRIVKKDLSFIGSTTSSSAPSSSFKAINTAAVGTESFDEVTISQMRKTIARRLAESKFTAPHFYLTMSINMDKAIESRKKINEFTGAKVSFNDFVLKATAIALKQHPSINSSWLGDKIRTNHHIHIGVAVAVEDGLLVPVVRFADQKGLMQLSSEVKTYAQKAKDKKLQPSDWEGNTFTISNLGMYGIDEFTAIINPPDACILAIGGISEVPIVKDGQIVPGNIMKVTLSCDHRVVDGASGSAFLQTLKALLEEPTRMLV